MLASSKVVSSTKLWSALAVQKRQFVLTAATTAIGALLFSENNRLANQMERGQLHHKDAEKSTSEAIQPLFNRNEPNYPGHVPLYSYEKLLMVLGSSIGAYTHPEKNQFIVALGESTAINPVLKRLQHQMLSDPVGRQILRERPRMTSTSLNLDYLKLLPDNTIGKTYINWLEREGVSPDTRVAVKYIDDEELAYVYQRYRECHDFYHAITGLPIIIEGEIAVKVLEYMNIGIPMSGLGALFAPFHIKPSQRERLYSIYYPWAFKSGLNSKPLINVYWENILEEDINEFRSKMGIEQPPDLRALRKEYFAKLKAAKKIV